MKVTDADAKVYRVDADSKFIVHVRSKQEVPQEILNDLYKSLHEWYFSPAKFFVLNLPDGVDLEFQKVDVNGIN